ncbi:helix-turn-helix domain-containing protein [Rhizobium bangladeshense]|uniref:helix-turn-helix domain-containing protein n=1 Tax=Rhizobium bangladeshense TaxID=1138189 RepID=UPI000A8AC628|nr:AraC family transcriptional regulator [Rhizobium bangladeshense]
MENIVAFEKRPIHFVPSCHTSSAQTSDSGPRGKAVSGLTEWQKSKIARYIDDNIDTCIRVGELGQQVGLSASRFSKGFKVSFGKSPYEYVLSRRIDAAMYLMTSTGDPLSHIAQICGLSDQAHLSKIFKRVVGMTPLKWRREPDPLLSTAAPCPRWTRLLPPIKRALVG